MKATLNYTDRTTKVFYLVSPKGDKGDTGLTGPVGPIGPRGPVGSGLAVKGTVTDTSKLPKIGNQEGYCYFVGKNLYIWDAGAWKNCGDISQDLSNYVTITDLNNGLSNKVTDNKNGTEQLNGVKVQPFNKLSDSVGGRNLLTGTQDWQGEWGNLSLWPADEEKYEGFAVRIRSVSWYALGQYYDAKPNTTYTFSFYAKASEASNIMEIFTLPTEDWSSPVVRPPVFANRAVTTEWQRYSVTFTTNSGGKIFPSVCSNKDGAIIYVAGYKLEKGSVATDWTPAPEDKQDKIGYTPADDSKVAHDNHDNTITANNVKYDLSKTGLTPLGLINSGSFNDLPLGTVYAPSWVTDGPDKTHGFITTTFYFSNWGGLKTQIAIANSTSLMYFRVYIGGVWNSWVLLSDDSKVVHTSDTSNWQKQAMFNSGSYVMDATSSNIDFATLLRSKYNKPGVVYIRDNTSFVDAVVICEGNGWWHAYGEAGDGNFVHRRIWNSDDTGWVINADDSKVVHSIDMRKPANDVAGIDEVNTKQDKIGYTPADDSKVTHNSSDDAIIYGNNNIFHLRTQLSSKDDIFKINNIGLYQATKVAPANNPLGTSKPISGDCISLWWSFIFVDNNGEVYVETPNTQKWDRKVSENGTNNFHGANNFDTVPTVKNNPLLLASSLPSDLARTGQANTFSSLQTFSQGAKTLQTGSYDDANSLVNEGLYYNTNSSIKNGAGSLTTGYIQVMSGYGGVVRQFMYMDTDASVMYTRVSQTGGSSWNNWMQIATFGQVPDEVAVLNQDSNFTAKLQKSGIDVATTTDVKNAVNTATANWVESDSDTNALSSSKSDMEGFYYTEEKIHRRILRH